MLFNLCKAPSDLLMLCADLSVFIIIIISASYPINYCCPGKKLNYTPSNGGGGRSKKFFDILRGGSKSFAAFKGGGG